MTATDHEGALRAAMIEIGRRLWERGMIAGTCGNFSVRRGDGLILATPSGRAKGRLTEHDLVLTDVEGTIVSGTLPPSSEMRIHLAAYRLRPDVAAVVHAHPTTVVAHSLAAVGLTWDVLPETIVSLGNIASVPYETPGTPELAQRMESALADHNAIVMERHGAVTLGRDLDEAYERMETLEHAAQTLYLARTLGRVEALPEAEVQRLLKLVT